MIGPGFLDNQINSVGLPPFFQDCGFVQKHFSRGFANWGLFPGVLINQKKFPVQIKNEAATVVQGSFKNRVATCIEPWIEKSGYISKRKIGGGLRDGFHHTEPAGDHRGGEGDGRKPLALLENKVQRPERQSNERDAKDRN